jgi:alkylated DNA repair protein alkB family protein 6
MTSLDMEAMFKAEMKKMMETQKPNKLKSFAIGSKEIDLQNHKIGSISNIFYCPNYLTLEEEEDLITHLYDESSAESSPWHCLSNRRLKVIGGIPTGSKLGMVPEELPCWLNTLFNELNKLSPYPLNHLLLNEYSKGQGIGAHKDGPLYQPHVFIISLMGSSMIEFLNDDQQIVAQVYLQPRSLLVFELETYTNFKHVIYSRHTDVIGDKVINCDLSNVNYGESLIRSEKRVSLTIRAVKDVSEKDYSLPQTPEDENELARRKAFFYSSVNEAK